VVPSVSSAGETGPKKLAGCEHLTDPNSGS
jgi:hypothetical protein